MTKQEALQTKKVESMESFIERTTIFDHSDFDDVHDWIVYTFVDSDTNILFQLSKSVYSVLIGLGPDEQQQVFDNIEDAFDYL